jgi:hypothetical protein
MDPVTAMCTQRTLPAAGNGNGAPKAIRDAVHVCAAAAGRRRQQKLSPQAQLAWALGLSMVKPAFCRDST